MFWNIPKNLCIIFPKKKDLTLTTHGLDHQWNDAPTTKLSRTDFIKKINLVT